ncbi:amidohydrolase family protein [Ruicaihuangia caeni]|uniref:Amidohydrolase family protein n=1 Tax=Ruicaihuangia caeni TaxID=3042517 RepID=A0AAW6TCM9_9MICO|nr:amidohydrolase family protein [Klugiella sp. YN-L-19]MDI2099135.1 amidohydrolase family protein [Klugiella sp. YN-L-19]
MSASRIIRADLAFIDDDWIADGAIAIAGDLIVDAGAAGPLIERNPGVDVEHWRDRILMPGGVNGHGHTFQALLRGFGDDLPFGDWMGRLVHPTAAGLTSEAIAVGVEYDLSEMLRMGITTAVEYFYLHDGANDNAWTVIEAAKRVGLRLVFARCMFDADPGPVRYRESPGLYERNFRELRAATESDPYTHVQPAPHSVLGASADMLRLGIDLAREFGAPMHVHAADSQGEVDVSHQRFGLSPIGRLQDVGALAEHTLAVHAVRIDEDDLQLLQQSGAAVVHNPSTNAFLAGGIAPLTRMIELGIPVCLGTDAGGANSRQSIFEEMRMAALLAKASTRDATAVTAVDAIRMGTSAGGRILRLPVGRLAPGHYADLVGLDLQALSLRPRRTVTQNVVYSMLPEAIATVVVGGKEVVKNGEVLTTDTSRVAARVDEVTASWKPLTGAHPFALDG